jgi:hypothetical protein
MSTITEHQQTLIAEYVNTHRLSGGLGTKSEPCSIAAINLALTGRPTDTIPDCMSLVVGMWIISVQDEMPDDIRNSPEWKRLLPLAAGTGRRRDLERERLALILDWMWGTVLPVLQPIADEHGYGDTWRTMCTTRTADVATVATVAARVTRTAYAANTAAADAAAAARRTAAAAAADATDAAALAATYTARAVIAYAAYAARAATATAYAAVADAARVSAYSRAWAALDPVGLLERLIEV